MTSIEPDNAYPWCVAPDQIAAAEQAAGRALPRCPTELFETASLTNVLPEHAPIDQALNRWALEGAAKAGFRGVFLLGQAVQGRNQAPALLDRCEELSVE